VIHALQWDVQQHQPLGVESESVTPLTWLFLTGCPTRTLDHDHMHWSTGRLLEVHGVQTLTQAGTKRESGRDKKNFPRCETRRKCFAAVSNHMPWSSRSVPEITHTSATAKPATGNWHSSSHAVY
jgi:hypothetical protein